MALAARRSTLKVPIRFTTTTVSKAASPAGPSFFTVRSAQPCPRTKPRAQLAEGLDRLLNCGADALLVGHVGRREQPADLLSQGRPALLVQVGDRHSSAASGQLARRGLAEAAGAARERADSVQLHAAGRLATNR